MVILILWVKSGLMLCFQYVFFTRKAGFVSVFLEVKYY